MPYRTTLTPLVRRQIRDWHLPDAVLVEVYLRLNERMPSSIENLIRLREPFDGLCYGFRLVDPENRLREHRFLFAVCFGQDEATIHVLRGTYSTWMA